MTFEVELRLKGAFREDAEAKVWVAYCPALRLYSQGSNQEEAHQALIDATQSFVSVCLERRILEDSLAKRGFSPAIETKAQVKESAASDDSEWITVRKRFDKGEFDFKVAIPYHLAHALTHQAA